MAIINTMPKDNNGNSNHNNKNSNNKGNCRNLINASERERVGERGRRRGRRQICLTYVYVIYLSCVRSQLAWTTATAMATMPVPYSTTFLCHSRPPPRHLCHITYSFRSLPQHKAIKANGARSGAQENFESKSHQHTLTHTLAHTQNQLTRYVRAA